MTSNDSLAQLASVLHSRKNADPESSYVARLLHKGPDAFLKKIGEEATELVMACKDADYGGASPELKAQAHSKIVNETADLWFHSMVALAHYGLSPQDVIAELDRRVGTSGLDEKAARKARSRDAQQPQPGETP
jgi:phosphoribosyl-ATP pyrophosphohydrolase